MKQSKKVVARIIILILALFTVIPGTVSQKVYAEPGGSESSQAADASKDNSNKKEEKKRRRHDAGRAGKEGRRRCL